MKVSTKDLRDALAFLGAAIERRHTLPVLSCVLIESRGDGARLVASDLDRELTADIAATGDIPSLCISHEKLKACAVGDGDMDISQAGEKVRIVVGRSKHLFGMLLVADFPRASVEGDAVELPASLIVPALKRIARSMAIQDIRYYLNGALIERKKNILAVVATDGFRLAIVRHENKGADFAAIIPRATVLAIIAMEAESLALRPGNIFALRGGLSLQSKTVEGQFPQWDRIVNEPPKSFTAKRADMLEAIAALAPSLGKFNFARVEFADGVARFAGKHDGNETTSEIEALGDAYSAGFNTANLHDAISECSQDEITVRHDGGSQGAIRIDDSDWTAVIMPARV